jgi:hypothetical protein
VKNKAFFFVSSEGTRDHRVVDRTVTVPTPAMLRGDFSGSDSPIYDPLSGNANGTGRTQFQVFPGDPNYGLCKTATNPNCLNIIPRRGWTRSRPDREPHSRQQHRPGEPQLLPPRPVQSERRQVDTKVDYNVNSKFNLAARSSVSSISTRRCPPCSVTRRSGSHWRQQQPGSRPRQHLPTTVMGTYIFSPTFLMDAHFGFAKQVTNSEQPGLGTNIGSDVLGIPAPTARASSRAAGPRSSSRTLRHGRRERELHAALGTIRSRSTS